MLGTKFVKNCDIFYALKDCLLGNFCFWQKRGVQLKADGFLAKFLKI